MYFTVVIFKIKLDIILQLTHRTTFKKFKSIDCLHKKMIPSFWKKESKVKRKNFSLTTYLFCLICCNFFLFLDNSKLKLKSGHATSILNPKNTT